MGQVLVEPMVNLDSPSSDEMMVCGPNTSVKSGVLYSMKIVYFFFFFLRNENTCIKKTIDDTLVSFSSNDSKKPFLYTLVSLSIIS